MEKISRPAKFLIIGLVLLLASLIPFYWKSILPVQYEVRAAIDIGSGSTKLRVAEVDPSTNRLLRLLASHQFTVLYQEDLEKSPDGNLSRKVMDEGIRAIQESVKIAEEYKPKKIVAIATEAIRKVKNSREFVEEIEKETGVKVHVIDQTLEGELAFQAAFAMLQIPRDKLIVFDIGGGSLQLTGMDKEGEFQIYRGHDAVVPFKNYVIREIKKENPAVVDTPNPMSWIEIQQTNEHAREVAKKVDDVFKKKILQKDAEVVGVGSVFSYGILPLVSEENPITIQVLEESVYAQTNKTDQEIDKGEFSNVFITNGALILGFMEALHMRDIIVVDINTADGALLYNPFW